MDTENPGKNEDDTDVSTLYVFISNHFNNKYLFCHDIILQVTKKFMNSPQISFAVLDAFCGVVCRGLRPLSPEVICHQDPGIMSPVFASSLSKHPCGE